MSNARNLSGVATGEFDVPAASLGNAVVKTGDTMSGALSVTNSSSTTPTGYFQNTSGAGDSPALIVRGGANNTNTVGTFEVQSYGGNKHLKVDGNGRVTMPYQPAWCYNTRNNWTNGQWNVLTFSSYWPISGNRYQGNYTTGTFTAPVAGIYQINFTDVPYSGGNSSAYVQYNLYKNGASWLWLAHSEYASVRNYEPVSASCVIEMAAGDSLAIEAYPSGMNNNNANGCTFSGFLIG